MTNEVAASREQSGGEPKLQPGAFWKKLSYGGLAQIRVARSRRAREFLKLVDAAAEEDNGDVTAGKGREVTDLIARWGMVDCKDVTGEDGAPMAFERSVDDQHPELGPICSRGFFGEAVTIFDSNKIAEAVLGANAVSDQLGKA